jgi:hypothetical protein
LTAFFKISSTTKYRDTPLFFEKERIYRILFSVAQSGKIYFIEPLAETIHLQADILYVVVETTSLHNMNYQPLQKWFICKRLHRMNFSILMMILRPQIQNRFDMINIELWGNYNMFLSKIITRRYKST